jgi:hypothetical protein
MDRIGARLTMLRPASALETWLRANGFTDIFVDHQPTGSAPLTDMRH